MRQNLELMALEWLTVEKGCLFVLNERSPRQMYCGTPDALGVTPHRFLVEIEIKRSVSDFRAETRKSHRHNRAAYPQRYPKKFWYLTPRDLQEKLAPQIPEWAGYLVPGVRGSLDVIKAAPVNAASQRLSLKECVRLAHMVSNHSLSVMRRADRLLTQLQPADYEPYWWQEAGHLHYEI